MLDTPAFDLDTTLAAVKQAAARATGSHGLVYELWRRDYERQLEQQVPVLVPPAHHAAVFDALRASGDLTDEDAPTDDAWTSGLCRHFLDADTCPCGCFES